MGHCRGAVVGDSLARLLEAAGFRVTKEYYVNDAGAQVDTLARSAAPALPRGARRGHRRDPRRLVSGRLSEAGRRSLLAAEFGDDYVGAPESEWLPLFRERGDRGDARPDPPRPRPARHPPRHLRVGSRGAAHRARSSEAMEVLRDKGLVYEGELERPKSLDPHDEWEPVELTLFRSTQFGDDQDRPMKKSDGSWTYFGADAAYHWQKAQRRRPPGQHLGRGPCRHRQARPVGGEGADRRPRRSRRQARPDGPAVPRRRAGEDVEARRRFRHARRRRRARSARTSSAS